MKKALSLAVLYYLRFFAKLKLSKINPIIIGVTGSAGKTSTVAAIEVILKQKYTVKSTEGTNSETGIPLSILGLKMTDYSPLDWLRVLILAPFQISSANPADQILVCEMGIDGLKPPKNMDYLLSIAQPKIGVFLNALPAHTEQMGNVENIFAEKSKLIKSLPADGTAIINSKLNIETKAKVIRFIDNGTVIPPALAIGKIFGIPEKTSHQILATSYYIPAGRGNIFKGINGSTLIDSSYNASPIPMINSLHVLTTFARPGLAKGSIKRRVAVLGDMRELGDLAESEHKKVAKIALKLADVVITVGPLWKKYAKLDHQFDNFYQAGKFLQKFLKKGDVVLFKGSQNTIFLEGAVEMCLANSTDATKLCRRGTFWDRQRNKYKHMILSG